MRYRQGAAYDAKLVPWDAAGVSIDCRRRKASPLFWDARVTFLLLAQEIPRD
ncbi:hypothetical protein GCM10027021_10850 [Dyella kyungheensis]